MAKMKNKPLFRRAWDELTPSEQSRRDVDVWIIKEVRRGKKSLNVLAREKHVKPATVARNTNAFNKVGRRWVVKKLDHLSYRQRIYESGKEASIVTNDSRERRKISRYFDAVFKLWYDGETEPLKKLKGLTVRDSRGSVHKLDTDPDSVQEILQRQEEAEFQGPNSV